jgi:hypothetical protein
MLAPGLKSPAARRLLLKSLLDSSTGWTTISGSPAYDAGEFSGGLAGRVLRSAPRRILARVGVAPVTSGHSCILLVGVNGPGGSEYYQVGCDKDRYFILKDQAGDLLDEELGAPADNDELDLRMGSFGVQLYVNNTLKVSTTDATRVNNKTFVLATVGDGTISIHPTAAALVIRR